MFHMLLEKVILRRVVDIKSVFKCSHLVYLVFSRRVCCSEQQAESLGDMPIVVPQGLCDIIVHSLLDQTDDQIMHSCQYSSDCANCHVGRIFMERYIPSIVKFSINRTMPASELKDLGR